MTALTAALPHHPGPAGTAPEVVLVAMDGVLVDWAATFHRLLAGHCGRIGIDPAFLLADSLAYWHPYDRPRDDSELQAITDTRSDPDLYTTREPIPDALRALSELREMYEVFVVTSTDPLNEACATAKADQLRRDFHLPTNRIILAEDKTLLSGQVLIDTQRDITGILHGHETWQRVVFDQPYNQQTLGPRLNGWKD